VGFFYACWTLLDILGRHWRPVTVWGIVGGMDSATVHRQREEKHVTTIRLRHAAWILGNRDTDGTLKSKKTAKNGRFLASYNNLDFFVIH